MKFDSFDAYLDAVEGQSNLVLGQMEIENYVAENNLHGKVREAFEQILQYAHVYRFNVPVDPAYNKMRIFARFRSEFQKIVTILKTRKIRFDDLKWIPYDIFVSYDLHDLEVFIVLNHIHIFYSELSHIIPDTSAPWQFCEYVENSPGFLLFQAEVINTRLAIFFKERRLKENVIKALSYLLYFIFVFDYNVKKFDATLCNKSIFLHQEDDPYKIFQIFDMFKEGIKGYIYDIAQYSDGQIVLENLMKIFRLNEFEAKQVLYLLLSFQESNA